MVVKVASYNCKNIRTSAHAVNKLFKVHNCDILLLQETWLFEAQLSLLGEINSEIQYAGKGADHNQPLPPIQMPRGYGGVAVLWTAKLARYVTILKEGSERIQCVELRCRNSSKRRTLVISVYFPCNGYSSSKEDFCACIDELFEIVTKYSPTHDVIIGADLNEDLNKPCSGQRRKHLQNFIHECNMKYTCVAPTFSHPNGIHTSEIDYFLSCGEDRFCSNEKVLLEFSENVSDHVPIVTSINITSCKTVNSKRKAESIKLPPRTNWDKVNTERYEEIVSESMNNVTLSQDTSARVTELCDMMLNASSEASGRKKRCRKKKPKLTVWNTEISDSLKQVRASHRTWVEAGRTPCDASFLEKKKHKSTFRRLCRQAVNIQLTEERDQIMKARCQDSKLFYKLINRQRGKLGGAIVDLNVGSSCYSGTESVLEGFKIHFENLAQQSEDDNFDANYHNHIIQELEAIDVITRCGNPISPVTASEMDQALKSIHKGKSADFYGINIEHVVYGGDKLKAELLDLVNTIFTAGEIPTALKVGVISPVFKNKGQPTDAVNYRGITVLPAICKMVETLLRNRIQTEILSMQNPSQRGFTRGSSPLNAAYILEEYYRDCLDRKFPGHVILVDARAAFDVVSHEHLMRRLFYAGIEDGHWRLIRSLHEDISSVVKMQNIVSEHFNISQGVRQGGILSTDLYKLYINPLLDRLQGTKLGARLGTIVVNNSCCADDVCLMGDTAYDTQVLINITNNFANEERYQLQPKKTVAINLKTKHKGADSADAFTLGETTLNNVDSAQHLGVHRTASVAENADVNVNSNLSKARRALYSLFGAGLHGENGLDPATAIQLFKVYILPVLLYGLELILPSKKLCNKLEIFHKKTLKQILSLPDTVADPTVYILTGLLPIEAVIDLKVLGFFNNLCRQSEDSLEKRILIRQLTVTSDKSHSWARQIPPLLAKYGLGNAFSYIDHPVAKDHWKQSVHTTVESYWKNLVVSQAELYPSLGLLNCCYNPGRVHPILLTSCNSTRDAARMPCRLRLLTGCYTLQSNRARYNQNPVSPLCQVCRQEDEPVRQPFLDRLDETLESLDLLDTVVTVESRVQLVLDYTRILPNYLIASDLAKKIECLCRHLLYSLHKLRLKKLTE